MTVYETLSLMIMFAALITVIRR
ncbi:putative holin-like toxin [Paenibacillus polymyxa]|nr:putative holin-like toxin [Paenibacillus polymyxa]